MRRLLIIAALGLGLSACGVSILQLNPDSFYKADGKVPTWQWAGFWHAQNFGEVLIVPSEKGFVAVHGYSESTDDFNTESCWVFGQMQGTFDGNAAHVTWQELKCGNEERGGKAFFVMRDDPDHISASWGWDAEDESNINLDRLDPIPAPTGEPDANWEGTWEVDNGSPVTWKKSGYYYVGTYTKAGSFHSYSSPGKTTWVTTEEQEVVLLAITVGNSLHWMEYKQDGGGSRGTIVMSADGKSFASADGWWKGHR